MSIVNGLGAPRLEITKPNGQVVTIDLPLPESNSEDPNMVVNALDAFDRESVVDHMGFKPRWTIDYSTFADGVDILFKIRHLLESDIGIVLVPHVDLPSRKFDVQLLNAGELSRLGSDGHRGLKLKFESTKLIDAIPFPQASLSGKRLQDMGTDTLADHSADVFHFYL